MYKIGIIGDRASVAGFMALGFSVFEADDPTSAREALRRAVASGEYAALFVIESIAREIGEEIDRCKDLLIPAVTVIPGKEGSTGYGIESLKKATERAIGADILFNNK